MKYIHQRPTLIVLDDPEDVENTRTREAMDRNLEWLLRSLVPTRGPNARIVVIGTPQRENCMVEMIAKMSDWKTHRYSALMNDDRDCLWPDGPWPLERLLREKKAMQEIGKLSFFNREYMCQVTSDDDRFLHEPQYYDGAVEIDNDGDSTLTLNLPNGETKKKPVSIFVGIDPATSVSQTADYTVIMPVAIDSDRNIYVLPYVRRRMRPSETIQEILRLNRNLKPRRVSLEATAAQETFRDILRNIEGEYIPGLEPRSSRVNAKTSVTSTSLNRICTRVRYSCYGA